jgi:hypothetical protein
MTDVRKGLANSGLVVVGAAVVGLVVEDGGQVQLSAVPLFRRVPTVSGVEGI